jgi:hypothetical protein
VLCIIALVFVFCTGCCVLGNRRVLNDSFEMLKGSNKQHQCRQITTLAVPFAIFALFGMLGTAALAGTNASNAYVEMHAHDVFRSADGNVDRVVDFYEFQVYTLRLDRFANQNTSDFRARMSVVFDAIDADADGLITGTDIFESVRDALEPQRRRFGLGLLLIAGVVVAFTALYRWHIVRLRKRDKLELLQLMHAEHRALKQQQLV